MNKDLKALHQSKSTEVFHIEAALNNLKLVCSLQAKNDDDTMAEHTSGLIQDLTYYVEELKAEITSYESEFKRLQQQDNDQVAMSMGYL
jgi:hypothetical protein